jgi:eukaryotic-like serine/threonine-protein kinase
MNLGWMKREDRRSRSGADGSNDGGKLGEYQLMEVLGSGGMAEVWKARSFGPGGFERQVVIKRIHSAHAADPEFLRLFVDEAKISGLLHHPSVVEVHGFGEHAGTPYLVMEFVEGPSVSRVLRTLRTAGRRMSPAVAAYVAREVCRALAYVHELGDDQGNPLSIVHRDVTPSNILFTRGGGVKLLDFGVAKFRCSESLTRAGTVRGKPAYLAPEQIEEKPIDRRIDLFALGVVLYEMLSLEHLFAGDSDMVTVKKVLEMEVPRPSTKCAGVPAALDAIVMKALERDPGRRYQNAAEMARDLDEVVIGSSLHVDEIVAFIASIEADIREVQTRVASLVQGDAALEEAVVARRSAGGSDAATVRERTSAARGGTNPFPHARQRANRGAAAVAGVALIAVALAAAFGLRINITTRNDARAAPAPAIVQCATANPG